MASAVDAMYSADAAAERAMHKLRTQLFDKSIEPARVRHALAEADISGDGVLDLEELDEALRFVGLFLDKRELSGLQRVMDHDGSGRLEVAEVMRALLGGASERRQKHAAKLWATVSRGAASVPPEAVLSAFKPEEHLDVKSGRRSAADVAGALAEELAECAGPSGEALGEEAVVACVLQWGAAMPSDDLFCGQVEDCFGVAEKEMVRSDVTKLDSQMSVVRAKAVEKKAVGQTMGFWLAAVCKHFDGGDCGGLTAEEFSRVLERLGLPLAPPEVDVLFKANGGGPGAVPDAPDRQPRVPWRRFVDAVAEGQTW